MSQRIPIYIPTYISNAEYKPARVLPRLLFYNGLVECESFYIESGSLSVGGVTFEQGKFPYFDNYNVVTGSFPTDGSESLLFNNEQPSYGIMPSGSLYTKYWDNYISLLYNPKTRLLNCSAIIPLADYVKMELNDIVNFRGNYYHLRAINNYSLKDGTCDLQLLGPIITDTFSNAVENSSVVTQCCTPTLNSVTQSSGNVSLSFTLGAGDCATCVATTIQTSTNNINWGNSNTAGCTSPRTLSLPTVATYYRIITECQGSISSTPSNSILFTPQNWYEITNCSSSATLTTQAYLPNTFSTNERVVYNSENHTITNIYTSNPGGAQVAITSAGTTGCPSAPPSTATLYWSFSEVNGGNAIYDLYINAVSVETRNSTSNGTYTVNVGDVITVGCNADQCTGGGSTYTNIVVSGEITDAACQNNGSIPSYVSPGYTVVSGDVGTNLYMDLQVSCDGGCI